MHIIQYQNCTNINGMIWHTVFSRLGLICLQLEFYMQSSMELHVVTSLSLSFANSSNNRYSNSVSQTY